MKSQYYLKYCTQTQEHRPRTVNEKCFVFPVSVLTHPVQVWVQERELPPQTAVVAHRNQLAGPWSGGHAPACHRSGTVYI